MKTLSHDETLHSLFSPNVLGLKDFMLMHNELHVLLATLHKEKFDLVHIYSDRNEAYSKTQKFIDNALTRMLVKYVSVTEPDTKITYATANYVLYGAATCGSLEFADVAYDCLMEHPRIGEVERPHVQGTLNESKLQIVQVNRYGTNDDGQEHDLKELHIYIPNNRI